MKYVPPDQSGSIVSVLPRYENFIGGKWRAIGGPRAAQGLIQVPSGHLWLGLISALTARWAAQTGRPDPPVGSSKKTPTKQGVAS